MTQLKVIIAGGREFKDYDLLKGSCDYYLLPYLRDGLTIEVVSGKARGADTLGEQYAEEKGYEVKPFPADWKKYKLAAGPIRNGWMADYGDALIAFWDGQSTGTANMIEQATEKGLLVWVINY